MKKILTLALALALAVTALAGCSKGDGAGSSAADTRTPEELTQLYTDALTANGGEMVELNTVITKDNWEEDMNKMMVESMGVNPDDAKAFAISGSLMNIRAYGIAAVMPADGKETAVKEALQGFIDKQKQNFEQYLADQYQVAESARLETLEDGTILLVMCQEQDAVYDAISAAIKIGKE